MDVTDVLRNGINAETLAKAVSGDWSAVASGLVAANVGAVTFRSQVSPAVTVDPFAPAPPEAAPNPILLLVKPEVVVHDRDGKVIAAVAPYGAPTENYVPRLVIGGVLLVVGLVTVIAWLGAAVGSRGKRN